MNLLHRWGRVSMVALATLSFPAAAITLVLAPPEYELETVRHAADHCLHLRRRVEPEPVAAAGHTDVVHTTTAAYAVDGGVGDSGASADEDAGADADESSDDANAPELLLSSRFNGESCAGRSDGAVIDDEADLPIALDAVRAVHEALAFAPEWIDEGKLALELRGCWRRGAVLDGVDVDRHENAVVLYLQGSDCAGTGRHLLLHLPIVTRGESGDYRRDNAIVAEERIYRICGTALLQARAAANAAADQIRP